jgi:hypothetical protein
MLNPSIYTCQDVIKEDLTTLVHLENVSFQWNEFITWETIPLYSTLMDVTLQALLAYKESRSFYRTFDTRRVDPCQQTRTCILYTYTQLCICIRIVFCILNGTLHFYIFIAPTSCSCLHLQRKFVAYTCIHSMCWLLLVAINSMIDLWHNQLTKKPTTMNTNGLCIDCTHKSWLQTSTVVVDYVVMMYKQH